MAEKIICKTIGYFLWACICVAAGSVTAAIAKTSIDVIKEKDEKTSPQGGK